MKTGHVIGGIEIFLLAALPAWMQSPTGTAFLHAHLAIADIIGAAYVGWRAIDLAQRVSTNPTQPIEEQK